MKRKHSEDAFWRLIRIKIGKIRREAYEEGYHDGVLMGSKDSIVIDAAWMKFQGDKATQLPTSDLMDIPTQTIYEKYSPLK